MKRLIFLLLWIPFSSYAQHTISGAIISNEDYSYAMLYKIEGVRQMYLQSATIKKDTIELNGRMEPVKSFQLSLPDSAAVGSYRIAYDPNNNGIIDVLYNKEDIVFTAVPNAQRPIVTYEQSVENILYESYIEELSKAQYSLDSLQVAYLKNPSPQLETLYKQGVNSVQTIQKAYEKKAEGKMVYHFIKATARYNAPEISKTSDGYFQTIVEHFYDAIDFNNTTLYNSSFLIDRISDYVFYMNFSEDETTQKTLHKKAIDTTLQNIKSDAFRADVIVFLVTQFARAKDADIADYLIKTHFDALPKELQNTAFRKQIEEQLGIAVGRTAPDFSWTEGDTSMSLHALKGKSYYLLIFYSTECSHCLREVPQLFSFLNTDPKFGVVAFAMETTPDAWNNYTKTLPGWHHVLGLNKWENDIARTYQINATPTYMILDASKRIIGLPEELEDVKEAIKILKE